MDDEINPGITKNLISAFEEHRFISSANRTPTHFQRSQKEQNVLIVLAHPEKSSFIGELHDAVVGGLLAMGHHVTVSDLCDMQFNPCTIPVDTNDTENDAETVTTDIESEQEKVLAADLIILQFPLTLLSYPAILKGWIERVFGNNFAVKVIDDKVHQTDKLKGKRVMLAFTTMLTASSFSDRGIAGDIDAILWPMQSIFSMCNMSVLPPAIHHSPETAGTKECQEMISEVERNLKHLFNREPVRFIPLECFNDKNEVQEANFDEAAGVPEIAANPFQHFGRPIKAGSMRTSEGRWLGKKGKRSTRDSWIKALNEDDDVDDAPVTNGN